MFLKAFELYYIRTNCKSVEEKSLINGVEVAIGETQDGWHYAQFTYRGAGFQLTASGLTDDEFAASAASLIR